MSRAGSRSRPSAPAARRGRRNGVLVAAIDLAVEMDRLRWLPAFEEGKLRHRRPTLKVRRASRRPNRVGFAVPDEWRISVTAYPGIRPGDAQETLLHELVHLHVGAEPGGRRWHGRAFREALHRAMGEAYGVTIARPRSVVHGAYADAIERARDPEQLRLPIAA